MKINKKRIVRIVVIVLIGIQFIRPEKVYEEVNPQTDFLTVTIAPKEIVAIMAANCYDCHSNQTQYPWYTNLAPFSLWINHHIEEGKEHLNFSDWTAYPKDRAIHKLEEFVEEVEEGEMPLKSYTWLHGNLSNEDKETLLKWVKSL